MLQNSLLDSGLCCSDLSRYDAEHPERGSSGDDENIYEEIADVKNGRKGRGSADNSGGGGSSNSSSNNSSKSSLNTDSGVHVNQRKFSSETLDFGPKSTNGRKISR
jgi:hypothetical protein